MTKAMVLMLAPLAVWAGVATVLTRACREARACVVSASAIGFAAGVGCGGILKAFAPGDRAYAVVRGLCALIYLTLLVRSIVLFLGVAGISDGAPTGTRYDMDSRFVLITAAATGMACAVFATFRLPGTDVAPLILLALSGVAVVYAASTAEGRFLQSFPVVPPALFVVTAGGLLLLSALSPRLELFTLLSMKVMKFTHDFVHQIFESMLVPDHLFFVPRVWDFIGLLFSKEVGFWGGLLIWFVPPVLVITTISRQPLSSVSHLRQGAARRALLASHVSARRKQLLAPVCGLLLFGLALYRGLNPAVEYWDPKPQRVSAGSSGIIAIPIKGEQYDLADGKLRKFIASPVRFFVLKKGDGTYTAALDACAICKPDGYGQGDGTVICYYCKTLIPLETVGLPGGCNPVPVRFHVENGFILIATSELRSAWFTSVLGARVIPESGR